MGSTGVEAEVVAFAGALPSAEYPSRHLAQAFSTTPSVTSGYAFSAEGAMRAAPPFTPSSHALPLGTSTMPILPSGAPSRLPDTLPPEVGEGVAPAPPIGSAAVGIPGCSPHASTRSPLYVATSCAMSSSLGRILMHPAFSGMWTLRSLLLVVGSVTRAKRGPSCALLRPS